MICNFRKSLFNLINLIAALLLLVHNIKAQQEEKIDVMNLYVEFLNESIHGLFTAHALLVINNKEVNKYIDLDSYSLNNLTNNEVQSNLFDKSDKANYTTFQGYSPLQLLELVKSKSKILEPSLANKLNARADKIGEILNRINGLRFEIADFIATHDLNEKESIYGVFELLEECAKLFDDYAIQQNAMVNDLGNAHMTQHKDLFQKAYHFHKINKSILLNLRNGNTSGISTSKEKFKEAFDDFEKSLSNFDGYNKNNYNSYIKNRKDSIYQHLSNFESSSYIPKAYQIYGKEYYYHNQIAKRFFNWSGPGYVRHLNELLEKLGLKFVHLTEEPLIFKVVYPMKLDELNDLEKEERYQVQHQLTLQNPDFKFSSLSNKPDSNYVSIEISDFDLFDRDSISLFINGAPLIENYCLTQNAMEIQYKIDISEDYILEIIAKNDGIIYPNTALISYRFKGTRKKTWVKTYLNSNQKASIPLIRSKI